MRKWLYVSLYCCIWTVCDAHSLLTRQVEAAYRRYQRAAHNYYALEDAEQFRNITPPEKIQYAKNVSRTLWQLIASFQN